jgi:hypothetical protein
MAITGLVLGIIGSVFGILMVVLMGVAEIW